MDQAKAQRPAVQKAQGNIKARVAICVPAGDEVKTGFAHDLAIAMASFVANMGDSTNGLQLRVKRDSLLCRSRENIVEEALLDPEVTHLLWIDSDMRFPPDVIERLLSHDLPIVGANCSFRVRPLKPTAVAYAAEDGSTPHKRVFPSADKHGVERVDGMGLALVMVKREVYESLQRPWHSTPWLQRPDGSMGMLGEDAYFYGNCKHHDIPVHIDHDLSWEVSHLGEHAYGMQDILDERDALRRQLEGFNIVSE